MLSMFVLATNAYIIPLILTYNSISRRLSSSFGFNDTIVSCKAKGPSSLYRASSGFLIALRSHARATFE